MLASEPFAQSDRLSRFLRYIVERTLAGEAEQLKEYVIGLEVYDRDERYDPRVDSIVRVEAGRLRAKVDGYYHRYGSDDPVVIRLQRGSYVPAFEPREPTLAIPATGITRTGNRSQRYSNLWLTIGLVSVVVVAVAAWAAGMRSPRAERAAARTIAVLPFSTYSTDENVVMLAARVTDGVTSALARLGTLGVVSHTSAMQFVGARRSLRDVARSLNADVLMEATLLADGNSLRIAARLVDGHTDRKVWVQDFVGAPDDIPDLERRIAAAIGLALRAR
jgi:TolB-like protein